MVFHLDKKVSAINGLLSFQTVKKFSNKEVETIPQMDSVKRVILYEVDSKLIGMQLQTNDSKLIKSFGELLGTQRVITLKDNEVLVGVKGREKPVFVGTFSY